MEDSPTTFPCPFSPSTTSTLSSFTSLDFMPLSRLSLDEDFLIEGRSSLADFAMVAVFFVLTSSLRDDCMLESSSIFTPDGIVQQRLRRTGWFCKIIYNKQSFHKNECNVEWMPNLSE